ncbi:MAG: twin-arginine translocase subunit TatC [Bacteroidales bacterium]|nr:twin-arginine translocase subunit TatC [Bacteroidales bacterium]
MPEVQSTKKKVKSDPSREMSFWEHLEELRWHLIRSIIVILVLSVGAFLAKDVIFDRIILAPKDNGFITNRLLCRLGDWLSVEALCMEDLSIQIINISLSGQFLTHMYTSIVAGLVVAAPYVIWELWRFVMPALHPREKRYSRGAVWVTSLLFSGGVLFSYFLIVPLTLNFLGTYQVSDLVENTITLRSYISTVVSVTFAVGLVFELPVLVYFLTRIGLITPAFLRRNRKITLVILLIISAVITPPDIFSQILVCIPLWALYEASIRISDRVYRKREAILAG